MDKNEPLKITRYSDWMLDQIVELFSDQYNLNPEEFRRKFIKFYEADYQASDCIRIVALDKNKVVGFQSFFLWPYRNKIDNIRAFQSGNSLVAPSHRGKGLFQNMLNYVYDHKIELDYDILIGFPVKASFGSFIRNGWKNLFDLEWRIGIINPLYFLWPTHTTSYIAERSIVFKTTKSALNTTRNSSNDISLSNDTIFERWRLGQMDSAPLFFHRSEENFEFQFEIKLRKRGPFNECIIGRIDIDSDNLKDLSQAIRTFRSYLRKEAPFVSMVSIAFNPAHREAHSIRKGLGLLSIKVKNKIHFIIKSESSDYSSESRWRLFRGDIDTW